MSQWRIKLVFFFIILFSLAIISRLIYLQIISHQYWQALAQGQQKFFISLQGKRGEIFFHDKKPLALNLDFDLVYAAPEEIKNPEETAEILSQILTLDKNLILEKLKKDSFYVVIKRKLTPEEVKNLKELTQLNPVSGYASNGRSLTGIYLGRERGRFYPFESLASKVIGFVDRDGKGQYGIEGYYDEILQGKEGFLEKEKGFSGYLTNQNNPLAMKGADLILTLDYNIQFLAEKLLEEAKENLEIESGEIVVMEPNSGKILALANFPNFNPNQYSKITNLEIFQNETIQKIFEPGSVFKPITLAAALDQEKITPQTSYLDEGKVKIGGYTIYNYDRRTWGERSMVEVLEKSINTGAVFAEQQLGHHLFLKYIQSFGFFEPTGIDLQGEVFSQNKEFKKGYEINFATASFGQGIEITSIQLLRAFAIIANGGKLIKPYLVEKILENGKVREIQPEIISTNIISPKTVSQLTAMLVSVVENGFAKRAKIPGYYIAGKTGTAQIPFSSLGIDKKGYSEKTIQSFIGFAPAFNPQFLILVKLRNPKTKTSEYSAVPIFHDLAEYIINYYQIPPDYEIEKK